MDQEEYQDVCEGTFLFELWRNKQLTIISITQMGKFNSDRAIMNYAEEYWNIEPTKVS